jgi:hypothetical protein
MLGAVLALVFSVFMGATPAGAATQTMNFKVTGSTQIGSGSAAQNFPANSGFSATVDTTTGAVTNGFFSIPTYTITETIGSTTIPIHVTIADTAPVTGNIDQTTGVASLNLHTKTTLVIVVSSSVSYTCVLGPFSLTIKTSNAGGKAFTGNPLTGTLTASGYTVPAVVGTGSAGACPDAIASSINSSTSTGPRPADHQHAPDHRAGGDQRGRDHDDRRADHHGGPDDHRRSGCGQHQPELHGLTVGPPVRHGARPPGRAPSRHGPSGREWGRHGGRRVRVIVVRCDGWSTARMRSTRATGSACPWSTSRCRAAGASATTSCACPRTRPAPWWWTTGGCSCCGGTAS